MTHIISVSMNPKVIELVDEVRKSSNIARSKLIQYILKYVCSDEELLNKAIELGEENSFKDMRIKNLTKKMDNEKNANIKIKQKAVSQIG